MKNKKISLRELKKSEKTLRASLNKIHDQIDAEEDRRALPKLKKQYEGKFFKFMNSCGSDSEKWPVYSFCRRVISKDKCLVDRFESDPYKNEFTVDGEDYFSLFQTEVTIQEYMNALTEFRNNLTRLGSNVVNELL